MMYSNIGVIFRETVPLTVPTVKQRDVWKYNHPQKKIREKEDTCTSSYSEGNLENGHGSVKCVM